MIKKNDLIKQFELITKQQIKNHNDLIAAHNSAVDEIRRSSNCNKEELALSHAALDSRIDKIESALNRIKQHVDLENAKVASCVNDVSGLISKILSKIEDFDKDISSIKSFVKNLESKHVDSCKKHGCDVKELGYLIADARQEAILSNRKLLKYFEKLLQDRDARPCKVKALKEELSERIEVKEVHTRGILEEIRSLRREFKYEQAKIENLYTLVGRLQKKA